MGGRNLGAMRCDGDFLCLVHDLKFVVAKDTRLISSHGEVSGVATDSGGFTGGF
jgi:hypothetical protein